MSQLPRFRRSAWGAQALANAITPYALADADGKAIIQRRSNGQEFPMVYRTERTARAGLARVKGTFPNAQIVSLP